MRAGTPRQIVVAAAVVVVRVLALALALVLVLVLVPVVTYVASVVAAVAAAVTDVVLYATWQALDYYEGGDMYLFDEFQTSRPAFSRRPTIRNLYDVFRCV